MLRGFDLRDGIALVGVAMVGTGLWLLYPPVALVVVGAALFYFGVRAGDDFEGI